ncbi:MAG: DUF3795 domain-containing protein [Coriobacteriales bacterium]|nr:DUF3795 domain-containing protein [Coriobacteriales bacterium]
MSEPVNTSVALSYCGINCTSCGNYKKNENCQGCRDEPNLLWDCTTRTCAIERGFLHCGQCDEFPCDELSRFYHDGKPSHLQAYHNMLDLI